MSVSAAGTTITISSNGLQLLELYKILKVGAITHSNSAAPITSTARTTSKFGSLKPATYTHRSFDKPKKVIVIHDPWAHPTQPASCTLSTEYVTGGVAQRNSKGCITGYIVGLNLL